MGRGLHHGLLGAGLLLGVGAGALTPAAGCILPDHCILVKFVGNDYCSAVENAQMWPIGEPAAAEPVFEKGGAPVGCRCLNATEAQQMSDHVPVEQYLLLREAIHERARNECAAAVPPGFDHNCYFPDSELSAIFVNDGPDRSATCFDSCFYANPPPNGDCPDDPDPFACNESDGADEAGDDAPEESADGVVNSGIDEVRL